MWSHADEISVSNVSTRLFRHCKCFCKLALPSLCLFLNTLITSFFDITHLIFSSWRMVLRRKGGQRLTLQLFVALRLDFHLLSVPPRLVTKSRHKFSWATCRAGAWCQKLGTKNCAPEKSSRILGRWCSDLENIWYAYFLIINI